MLTEDIRYKINRNKDEENKVEFTKEMYNESLSIIQDILGNIGGSKLPIDFSFDYINYD